MIVNSPKYHYKITWGSGGVQYDVYLQKPIELTRKLVSKEIFWRTESSEWIILRWMNKYIYDTLLAILDDVEGTTFPVYALVHYYDDGITFTRAEFAGTISLDGVSIDRSEGKLSFKPKPYDVYSWYDDCKDNKLSWKSFRSATFVQEFIGFGEYYLAPITHYFNYCVKLSDLITWVCGIYAWKYTFVSDILTSATNPVTNATNELKSTFVTLAYLGKSGARTWANGGVYLIDDVVFYQTDSTHAHFYRALIDNTARVPDANPTYWVIYEPLDDDVILDFQVSDVFDILKKLKIFWYIDPYNNYIVFEHLKYFKNGLNYGGTQGVGVDLTDETKYLPKYHVLKDFNDSCFKPLEYKFEEICAKNTLKYSASPYPPVVLIYDSFLAVQKKNNDETMGKSLGEVGLFILPENYEKVDDSILMLLHADTSSPNICIPVVFGWVNTGGYLADGSISWVPAFLYQLPNAALFVQTLFPKYIKYGLDLSKGTINDVATTFLNTKPYKYQTLRFPRVEAESNYYDIPQLITTELGNGELMDAKILCDTGWVEVKVGFNA